MDNISAPGSEGSKVITVYQERKVRVFSVFDSELKSISLMNSITTIFFSVGAYFLPDFTTITFRSALDLSISSVAPSLVCFCMGVVSFIWKYLIIRKIEKESYSR